MRIDVLTLFPDMLRPMLGESILGRAAENGLIDVRLHDIRDYTLNKHHNTDDYPFGGGAGMVMYAQPICDAVRAADPDHTAHRIYLSPRGRTLDQKIVEELGREEHLLLLCGHYEGVDQRALDLCIDEEMSIGDYVLTGGELGALVLIDAVSRMVPGVLGSAESGEDESFTTGLLEYPQYTRPAVYQGMAVPEVLLGGNHADIEAWRREQSLEITMRRRPELLDTAPLTDADRAILARLRAAENAIASLGIPAERLPLREADAFEKRWFNTFVPEEKRKAAKKQCFSGRRHVGYLWQAFSMGFIDSEETLPEGCFSGANLLYLPEEKILLRVSGEPAVSGSAVLCDEAMTYTRVSTGRKALGPYLAKI